jgi:hypothetical protein
MSCGLWHALNTLTIRLASSIARLAVGVPIYGGRDLVSGCGVERGALAGKPWLPRLSATT